MSTDLQDGPCLFGGTFDPIHAGHVSIATSVLAHPGVARVIFLPSATPPHKTAHQSVPRAPFAHRLEMTRIAAADQPRFEVSDRENRRAGPSYTIDLVREIREEIGPERRLFFLIGADWVPGLSTWVEIEDLFACCEFLVAPRPGFERDQLEKAATGLPGHLAARLARGWLAAPSVDVSSTEVRERLSRGRGLDALLPPGVEDHIRAHHLYGT